MSGRQAFQAKESAPAKKSSFSWLRPAAAHPAAEAEHEVPSASSPSFAHDFTKVPVRPMQLPGVPGFSCPFAPQRCPSGGACHTCPPKMQAKLKIGQPGDQYEQEADRVAEAVVSENPIPKSILTTSTRSLQRIRREPEKPKEDKLEELLEKLVEAALETPQFKQILDLLKNDTPYKRGKEFAGTLPGFLSISSIIAGLGTAGAAALIDASEELPMQIPEIPLGGGHSVKLTINGPLDEPSDWSIAYTFTATSDESSSDASADTKRIRAETNRLVMQNEYTRTHTNIVPNSSETLTERAKQIYQESNTSLIGRRPIQVDIPPIGDQKPESGLRLTPPKSSFGYKSEEPLIGSSLKLTPPNERKKREEDTALQRKSNNARTFDSVPPIVHDVISSAGQPLDYSTRSFMELRFGQDFSGVRVHTGGEAEESARAVNARAYTVGRDVVFGEGQYAPSTAAGVRLLSHELTHVVQQAPGIHRQAGIIPTGPFETGGRALERARSYQPRLRPHIPKAPTISPPPIPQEETTTPATCPSSVDVLRDIRASNIGSQTEAEMQREINLGRSLMGQTIQSSRSMIIQADRAIRAEFGRFLPTSRNFAAPQSVTTRTPQEFSEQRIPDEASARRRIGEVALEVASDQLSSLCINDPTHSVLQGQVVAPLFNRRGLNFVRDYERTRIGGQTRFPVVGGQIQPHVDIPSASRNMGHIVVHEALHYYVNEIYQNTAEASPLQKQLMEGGAEFLARHVINQRLSNDPNFQINTGTYSAEFSYVATYLLRGGLSSFPLAYFQGRVELLGLMPPAR